MSETRIGVVATSRKPDERRLPIHPAHLAALDEDVRRRLVLETGYGLRHGIDDAALTPLVGGLASRDELLAGCEVCLVPKPVADDLRALHRGRVLWGWPHCVQDGEVTQVAIDNRLTVIAWEAMNTWTPGGEFMSHVFQRNNELAGYASVLHAMELTGTTGAYGRPLRAAVVSFGATGRGALAALQALGVDDVTVLTQRPLGTVMPPVQNARVVRFGRDPAVPSRCVVDDGGQATAMAPFLAGFDIVVNCILQDTDAPLLYISTAELALLTPGTLIVDVSCDEGMGFEWARPTSFREPMLTVGGGVHYYAVDHSPSHLWNSATWEISRAVTPHLGVVLQGRSAWDHHPTIGRAVEIEDGVVRNPRILSFQQREPAYPHRRLAGAGR